MSPRARRRSPWWGLFLWAGCLNPQPDTNPLSPEANGAATPVVDVSPPAPAPEPGSGTPPAVTGSSGASEPEGLVDRSSEDAGAPDAGATQDRTPVTFSTNDAGLLQPDAGPPSSSED